MDGKLEFFPPPTLNLLSPREHCQRIMRWMRQPVRKAVCDGTGCKGGWAGVTSLESDPTLDPPTLGPWAASCLVKSSSREVHAADPRASWAGTAVLPGGPMSCSWREGREHQAYPAVIPALRQEDGKTQASLGYTAEALQKMKRHKTKTTLQRL